MSVTEEELIMKSQIYLQILESQTDNDLTIDNAADELVEPITEIVDIKSFIKKSLRDCLLQLGEIASIRQNLEIKSLKELMQQNTNIIEGLRLENPVKVEECTSDNIEVCKQKLQQYKQQLQEMVNKAKTITEEKQAEVENLKNENNAIKELSEKLKTLNMENLDNIDLSVENLPQEEQDKVALIMDTLKQIKEIKAKQESSQKEITEQENELKEVENRALELQKQATDYEVQTAQVMEEERKKDDDPEGKAIDDELAEDLKKAENITKKSDDGLQRQLTGTDGVDVKDKAKAFDKTAQKVQTEGLVDTDAEMQQKLEKDKSVVESDITVENVGTDKEEEESLEQAQNKRKMKAPSNTDNKVSGLTETTGQEPVIRDNKFKTDKEGPDGNKMGGRNKKSRKNRKSSKKKSKKNRK